MFGPLPLIPPSFDLPERVVTDRFTIRLMRVDDYYRELDAYMSSKEHLQRTFNLDGVPFGVDENGRPFQEQPTEERWPEGCDLEFALIGAAWCHYEWKYLRSSFTYVILDPEETRELGNGYVYPCHKQAYEAMCQTWVRADEFERGFDEPFYRWFRDWVESVWPFEPEAIGWPGREIPWDEWNALPDSDAYEATRAAEAAYRQQLAGRGTP